MKRITGLIGRLCLYTAEVATLAIVATFIFSDGGCAQYETEKLPNGNQIAYRVDGAGLVVEEIERDPQGRTVYRWYRDSLDRLHAVTYDPATGEETSHTIQ